MGELSPAMLAELRRSNPRVRRMVSFAFPDGTRRYSDVALCSDTLGFHEPRIRSWGRAGRGISDRQNALEVPEWRLEILDPDRDWSSRAANYTIKGTPVQRKYVSPRVLPADWYTAFDGVLHDWEHVDEMVVAAICRPNDTPLYSNFPTLRITQADFPNCPNDNLDIYVPIGPYGRHDSFGIGKIDGQIQPIYVDKVGFRYLIGVGRIKSILHAYRDGIRLAPNLWTLVYETVNGRTYSLIDFTRNRASQLITLDVEGYEATGDGTGALITHPVDQIKHALVNFVWNENFAGGAWLADSEGPIHTGYASATKTWLSNRRSDPYVGGRYLAGGEQRTGVDVLNDWLAGFQLHVFWTRTGKLAIRPDDFDNPGYTATWKQRIHEEMQQLKPVVGSQSTIQRVMTEGVLRDAGGQYQEKLEVFEPRVSYEQSETISMPWGPGYTT